MTKYGNLVIHYLILFPGPKENSYSKLSFHVGVDPGQVMGKVSEHCFDFSFWITLDDRKVSHSLQLLASIFGHTHKLAKVI